MEQEEQKYKDSDNSDTDASEDNFGHHDLYSKVYMQKDSAIKKNMRETFRAHQNFIQDVKIMIKKKEDEA